MNQRSTPTTAAASPAIPSWRAGVLMGALGMLAFSGTFPATRAAVPYFGPTVITGARILVAAALGALLLLAIGRLRWPGRRYLGRLLRTGICLAIGFPFFVALALEDVPSAHGAVVVGLAPAATAILAVMRARERPPWRFWAACAVGIATVLVFAFRQGGGAVVLADLWLAAAMLSVGFAYVEGGRMGSELSGTEILCWSMIVLAPLVAGPLAVAVLVRDWQPIPPAAWAGFGYACVISMFLGSVLWYRGLVAGGIARIGQLNLIQPLFTLLWSALLLGERVDAFAVACAAVILVAMAVCLKSRVAVAPAKG